MNHTFDVGLVVAKGEGAGGVTPRRSARKTTCTTPSMEMPPPKTVQSTANKRRKGTAQTSAKKHEPQSDGEQSTNAGKILSDESTVPSASKKGRVARSLAIDIQSDISDAEQSNGNAFATKSRNKRNTVSIAQPSENVEAVVADTSKNVAVRGRKRNYVSLLPNTESDGESGERNVNHSNGFGTADDEASVVEAPKQAKARKSKKNARSSKGEAAAAPIDSVKVASPKVASPKVAQIESNDNPLNGSLKNGKLGKVASPKLNTSRRSSMRNQEAAAQSTSGTDEVPATIEAESPPQGLSVVTPIAPKSVVIDEIVDLTESLVEASPADAAPQLNVTFSPIKKDTDSDEGAVAINTSTDKTLPSTMALALLKTARSSSTPLASAKKPVKRLGSTSPRQNATKERTSKRSGTPYVKKVAHAIIPNLSNTSVISSAKKEKIRDEAKETSQHKRVTFNSPSQNGKTPAKAIAKVFPTPSRLKIFNELANKSRTDINEESEGSASTSQTLSSVKKTKLPDFTSMHQKMFDKMESIDETVQRRVDRLKALSAKKENSGRINYT